MKQLREDHQELIMSLWRKWSLITLPELRRYHSLNTAPLNDVARTLREEIDREAAS